MKIPRLAGVSLMGLALLGCVSSDADAPGAGRGADGAGDGTVEAAGITDERLALGRGAYREGMCFKCHAEDGRGSDRAPDLTDGRWHHCDGTVEGILGVLRSGVPRERLHDPARPFPMNPATNLITDEGRLLALAEYVWSLSHR